MLSRLLLAAVLVLVGILIVILVVVLILAAVGALVVILIIVLVGITVVLILVIHILFLQMFCLRSCREDSLSCNSGFILRLKKQTRKKSGTDGSSDPSSAGFQPPGKDTEESIGIHGFFYPFCKIVSESC